MRTLALLVTVVAGLAGTPDRATVSVHPSAYGAILFDGKGFALYAFTKDPRGRSTCGGACAAAWPPFVVPNRARAGTGVRAGLLGVVERADGRVQATYAGRPLYHYAGDRRPGQILCQNVVEFGGAWRVVRGSGRLVH
jgi:predicted lipoprotein with Yx(FWY)xxD motif